MKLNKKDAWSLSDGYLKLSGVLLFCGILITGVVMVCSALATYTDTVERALIQNCEALSANLVSAYQHEKFDAEAEVPKLIYTAEKEYGYRIWLYDRNAKELYPCVEGGMRLLTPAVRSYLERDDYIQLGYFSENAEQLELFCAIRFFAESPEGVPQQYYLCALSEVGQLQEYSLMLVRNLVICLLIAVLVFMVLFRMGARKLDQQFEEVSQVIRQYAEGEFTARVNLQEHDDLYAFGSTLNHMAEFIEQNETTRRNFVANVSHELRTPMTTIGGFADGILDGTIPPEQQRRYIKIIAEEIHRLRTLVNSMLNLTKFEAGEMKLRISNVDIPHLLIKTVLMFEKRINDRNVEVEGLEDISFIVRADEDLIFQVLYNLIENAVKFVDDGGTISFSVRTDDEMACIEVKNTGEGLANDELPKIFDRFYKTDTSRSKDKTGLGLGLSIARKIVHLHQGHIVVKSIKGEYTSFEVQLPVNGL